MIKDTKSKVYTYGFDDGCDFQILDLSNSLNGLSFKIKYQEQIFNVKSKLIGKFNAYNITAAFVSTFLLGIEPQIILKAIEDFEGVSGRFQVLKNKNKTVVIDYSHTPDSLQKALSTLNELTNNPIYCVFGAGGDRDKTKRPIMGKIASELSKKVFVTSDNPRTEDPEKIIDDIIAGIKYDNFIRISDRENAIKEAILNTEDNAVILIAGKGHEDYQIIGKTKIHFSDAEIANKYLELL
jgi:UDP-N-acetylmuramoyl-L-alanyl-D-glutamate--2,6-diaminopimelate ligase